MAEPTTDRPTEPGWYWIRGFNDSPWMIVRITEIQGQLCANDPHHVFSQSIAIADPFWDGTRWLGPISPEDLDDRRRLDFLSLYVVRLQSNTLPGWKISSYDVNVWPDANEDSVSGWPIRGWGHGRTLREAIDAAIANVERRDPDND